MRKIFIITVITLVVVVVAYGLYLTGSPEYQRQVRFDERRVEDLQQISRAISSYHDQAGRLPNSLEALEPLDLYVSSIMDPKTGELYEYIITGQLSYDICAVFESDSSFAQPQRFPGLETWEYEAGRQCFSREVLVKAQD